MQWPPRASKGSRIITRETISAMRKERDGEELGDITRKRKLWAKQAAGKKRLKQVGQKENPQEAFWVVLQSDQ